LLNHVIGEFELALKVVVVWQLMVAFVTDGFVAGVMVIVTGIAAETHPVPVQVIFAIPFPERPVIVPPEGFGNTVLPEMSCVFVIWYAAVGV
jgi:hypothetical protein